MEMVEMTKGQIDFSDVNVGIQERLTFNGDEEEFAYFCNGLTQDKLKSAKQLEVSIKPKEDARNQQKLQEELSLQDSMKTCLCCAALHDACPGFMCCLDCLIIILFFWIICPIFCCWAYCKGKAIQESVLAILALKEETYEKLEEIGGKSRLLRANVEVVDLTLNRDKIGYLKSMIEKSGIMEFRLQNNGVIVKAQEEGSSTDYDNFKINVSEITRIQGLKYNIQWGEVRLSS